MGRLMTALYTTSADTACWYHGYIVKQLAEYGSTLYPAPLLTAVRVYAHSLQTVSTPEQWSVLMPAIQQSLPAEGWREMVREYHLETQGKRPY
eukprot:CAMPEP_0182429606 /NCGR_PEP_ID=MMETSP1167-20130531/31506_1 /TAXON_ID=2988 /ORGANISM="Mallomonas Sp, Strain CCMP3275" /LENGTH=92 /DNA_ID=CAMNT_0024613531 /DNA_START=453 /DNA_END=731 /DNA_ORIENTATION=-